ncbi:hypothetical protein ACFLY9_02495 [Patescibacteria group bacterium]
MKRLEVDLSNVEEELIVRNDRTVLVRPENTFFKGLQKGDILEFNGYNLLVINVRDYPRIEELLKIEPLEWIVTNAKDIVRARQEYSTRFSKERRGGLKFLAIEFAKQ